MVSIIGNQSLSWLAFIIILIIAMGLGVMFGQALGFRGFAKGFLYSILLALIATGFLLFSAEIEGHITPDTKGIGWDFLKVFGYGLGAEVLGFLIGAGLR